MPSFTFLLTVIAIVILGGTFLASLKSKLTLVTFFVAIVAVAAYYIGVLPTI